MYPTRRRSAGYVRQWSDRSIHALLGRMQRERVSEDLSEAQEWLWDQCVSELEYRWRRTRPVYKRCSCQFCIPPFPD